MNITDCDNTNMDYAMMTDNHVEEEIVSKSKQTKSKVKKPVNILKTRHSQDLNIMEIGVDEAGRGPMFGRVYAGAVILPELFDHSKMKDSKKFTSKKRIEEAAEYIKSSSLAWAVAYEDESVIDEINILQATQSAMHKAIKDVMRQISISDTNTDNILLLIDGNYFKPITVFNKKRGKIESVNYTTVTGGDNAYTCIAAASILAKVERDKYIEELCKENPELDERYAIASNMGYGAKKHMDGIKQYGITKWHRRTFGICRNYS